MDLEALAQNFIGSSQGKQALAALQEKGIPADAATTYLSHTVAAVGQHTEDHAQSHGLLGDHPGKSFFAAFASGLVKGDGVMGALEDGAAGVVTARVVEFLCDKAGVDSGTAETIAAAATPYAVDFVKSHLAG